MRKWVREVTLATLATAVVRPAQAEPPSDWQRLKQEKGIVVSTREEPGQPLPRLRAQGTITGNVLDVLAVVLDDARADEWAKGSTHVETLRTIDARTQLVYTRSEQPWPIHDRDLVMRRTVEVIEPGEQFRLHMVCAPDEKPKTVGVVRVRECESTLLLRKVDAHTTAVDYQLRLDPGGRVPPGLVRWASERVPFDTLVALERQVKQTSGH